MSSCISEGSCYDKTLFNIAAEGPWSSSYSAIIVNDSPLRTEQRVNESLHPCSIKSFPCSYKVSLKKMKGEGLKFYHVILEHMRSFIYKWEGNLRQDSEPSVLVFGFTFNYNKCEVEITTAINRSYSVSHTLEA